MSLFIKQRSCKQISNINKYRSATTVFTWFSSVWLLVVQQTQETAPGTPFSPDWGDKNRIAEGSEGYSEGGLCQMFWWLENSCIAVEGDYFEGDEIDLEQ